MWALIESGIDVHDADRPMTDKEDVDSFLKYVKEGSNLIIVDSSCIDAK